MAVLATPELASVLRMIAVPPSMTFLCASLPWIYWRFEKRPALILNTAMLALVSGSACLNPPSLLYILVRFSHIYTHAHTKVTKVTNKAVSQEAWLLGCVCNAMHIHAQAHTHTHTYIVGNGMAPEAGHRQCHVCNVPVDKDYAIKCNNVRAANVALANPHFLGSPLPKESHKHPLKGRRSKKWVLSVREGWGTTKQLVVTTF